MVHYCSKEVWKSNFRQYGQMKKQRWEEQRGEEKKKDQRRERIGRKKMQAREEGRKVAKHCVLPMVCDSGGSKSRLAKAAGAEPSGEMREEQLHAVVARCTFRSQSAQKPHMFGTLLEVESSKKCTPLWREARFEVKSVKSWRVRSTFGRSDAVLRGRRKGLCTLSKVSKTWRFWSNSKALAGVGHLKRICKDEFRVVGAIQETCSSEMPGGPGADFPRGVAFWSIRSSGLVRWFLCDTRSTSYDLACAVLQTDGVEKSQNGRQLCTQVSIFEGSLPELRRFWCCQLRKLEPVLSGLHPHFLSLHMRAGPQRLHKQKENQAKAVEKQRTEGRRKGTL